MLLDAMTGKPERSGALGAADTDQAWREKDGFEKTRTKEMRGEREGERGRTKLLELRTRLQPRIWGFATTAGIPSHKPAKRAAAYVSSSTRRRRRLREKGRENDRVRVRE